MKNLLLDIWHDLRAKRLWPVALVLLAGLVAVPVVLSKKADEPTVAPPAPAKAEKPEPEGPAQLAQVKLEDLGQGTGSSLSSFDDPSNPFAPPPKVLARIKREGDGTAAGTGGDSGSGGAGATGSKTTVEGGSLGGGAATPDTGSAETGSGDTGSGDTGSGDTGGGDVGDTGDTPAPPVDGGEKTTTVNYTYVADVTFRANDRRRKIKAMEKLDMLPDRASPLLIFLGVTEKAGNAVFLVDSTLDAVGEGSCKPSRSECAFLYLGPGSEHEFANDEGDSYTLRVDEIRRVEVGGGKKKGAASKKDRKTASAAVEQPSPARRFSVPLLADVVSVSSGEAIHSNSDPDRR
jgi:hypothetical protein